MIYEHFTFSFQFTNALCVTASEKCIKEEDEDFIQLIPNCNPCDDSDGNESSNSCRAYYYGMVPSLCAAGDILASYTQYQAAVIKLQLRDTLGSMNFQSTFTEVPQVFDVTTTPGGHTEDYVQSATGQCSLESVIVENTRNKNVKLTSNVLERSTQEAVMCYHHLVEPDTSQSNRNVSTGHIVETPHKPTINTVKQHIHDRIVNSQQFIEPSTSTSEDLTRNVNVEKSVVAVPQMANSADDGTRHPCKVCGMMLKTQRCLERHMSIHTGEKPHKCSFCDMKFRLKSEHTKHELRHKGLLPQCPVCGGRYACLQSHMLIHSDDSYKHICSVCKKAFRTPGKLKDHMLIHTGERPCICNDCGSRFQTSTHLKKHMVVHTKEKKHGCNVCGKTFSQSAGLRSHMRTHSEEKPYHCETCGKSFKQKPTLDVHKAVHSSEKRFVCSTCGKQFRCDTGLWRHKLIHTGEQPYECSVCRMRFNQSSSMKRHMLVHTGEKPYSCSDCGERFTQSGGLASHRRRHCPINKASQN